MKIRIIPRIRHDRNEFHFPHRRGAQIVIPLRIVNQFVQFVSMFHRDEQRRNDYGFLLLLRNFIVIHPIVRHPMYHIPRATRLQRQPPFLRPIPPGQQTPLARTPLPKLLVLQRVVVRTQIPIGHGTGQYGIVVRSVVGGRREREEGGGYFGAEADAARGGEGGGGAAFVVFLGEGPSCVGPVGGGSGGGGGSGVFVEEAVTRTQGVADDDAGGAQSLGAAGFGFEGTSSSFDEDVSSVEGEEGGRVEEVGVARGVGIIGGAEGFGAEAAVVRGGEGQLVGGVVFGYVVAATASTAATVSVVVPTRLELVRSQMIQGIRQRMKVRLLRGLGGRRSEVRSPCGDAEEEVHFDASSGGAGRDGEGGRAADVEVACGGGGAGGGEEKDEEDEGGGRRMARVTGQRYPGDRHGC
mmetsp:Transcript_6715/g.14619  ORF Transcript_6715/g.14619 Transcript_6715/m.14619 type:complete len:410 (+) Transcript_6715:2222-3451(+)